MKSDKFYTTQEKAQTHDTTTPLLRAMYSEFKEISKKKPDSAVSKGKIKIIERPLIDMYNSEAVQKEIEFRKEMREENNNI